jgi:hypothetical protein
MTQSYDKETCTVQVEPDFGWWRSWISLFVFVVVLGGIGYAANRLFEAFIRVLSALLGIGS